jgi:ectoine hydroxylase-related dioxygenase (phytanoyl-CoA dioxygenase family)
MRRQAATTVALVTECSPSTPGSRDRFARDGWVKFERLIEPEEAAALQSVVEPLVEGEGVPGVAPSQVQRQFGDEGSLRLVKISQLTRTMPEFERLAHDNRVVEVVERLIGEGARLFRDVVVVKPARTGGALSMHQDSAYWDVEPPSLCSVWIALSDAPVDASCFAVISGTHRTRLTHGLMLKGRRRVPQFVTKLLRRAVSMAGTGDNPGAAGGSLRVWKLKRLVLAGATRRLPILGDLQDLQVLPEEVASSAPQQLPIRAGDAIFFHSLLVHGTGPNTSPTLTRFAEIISYMPANARFTGRGGTEFPLARQHSIAR